MAREPKMITCKYCNNSINAKVVKCPHCGSKVKKPIFKKWWFWAIIVVLLIGIGGGSGGDAKKIGEVSQNKDNTSANAESNAGEGEQTLVTENTAKPEASESAPVQTLYKVGDILHDGNMDIVFAATGDYKEDNKFSQPEQGKKYIFAKFAFINTSDSQDASVSIYNFECYADGYACDMYYGGEEDLSATLSAGRSTCGNVYFTVPEDAKNIEIEYNSNIFTSEKITFVFEGDADSGYELQKNVKASSDALKVGDKTESKQLSITYLNCFKDKSNNQFITPTKGCHYVTCEFEFENISDNDEIISFYSFDAYADGISCNQAYFRDDSLSATLSGGRKAKGTVTFEVPDDVQVLEVEYLTNYWTSNRVVFDGMPE